MTCTLTRPLEGGVRVCGGGLSVSWDVSHEGPQEEGGLV